ncbi:autotransporter protein [Aquipluma nitroreducens]|uniref:Autotransporter protein n=2 Tax=Aquipluma nitroreducens TaxID=2010828 RepID=A0A5K7S4H6_9BACT|nr:autotransporter protein [Aquipluma nitroreducens]
MLLFSVTFVQAATKTSILSGNWNTAVLWSPAGIPEKADNVIIHDSVIIDSSTTVELDNLTIDKTTGKLVVVGTLVVNGDLSMDFSGNDQSELVLSSGSKVIVNGNANLGNKVSLDLSSYFIVRGDFYKQGSANQGIISISGAHIYIFGTVDTPWSNFTTTANGYSGTTETIGDACDYGTSIDLANNITEVPEEILASFNCASSTTPSWGNPWGIPHSSGGSVGMGGTISLTAQAQNSWQYNPIYYHWSGPNGFSQTTANTSLSINNASGAMSGFYVCTAVNAKGCSITDSAYVVVSDCIPAGFEYFSRDNYTGLWTDPALWGTNNPADVIPPPYNPNNSHTIGISGYITIDGNLTLGTSTQYLCDTLVVTGDFLATKPTLTIGPHGVLVVLGNYTGISGSIINNQGRIIVAGDFQNPPNWSVIANNGGDVYVFDQSPVLGGLVPTGINTIDLNSADNPLFGFYCTLAGGNCPANPEITGTTPGSRCGSGTVTLQATASPEGSVIKWYDQATGGNLLATGNSYTTASISTTTSYYVDATYNGTTSSPRSEVIATIEVLSWIGDVSTDWNISGNWSCGVIPDLTTDVLIPNVPNKPILQNGAEGAAKNIVIDNGSSLTVIDNTIQIAGTVSNSGTFTATAGTIEMKGSVAQSIGADVFAGNTIMNLTINNSAGVSLLGPLLVTGIVAPQNGNLSSGGQLTLVSTAAQTALIDGSGTGTVTGNVIVQRYLPSSFGYKYFSSPFQSATVNAFAAYLDLGASFPAFYTYDESKTTSGWVTYTNPTGPLTPMLGYAANFGTLASAVTVSLSGVVNDNILSPITLYNTNETYTKGFNLVGNPYPSPIDWDAVSGWTRGNVDNAVYYFNTGSTDPYTGTYSTYINGVSSDGIANNMIAAMQGFFVHVSDGAYPVSATFGLDNWVRVNNLAPVFKSACLETRPVIRLTAEYSEETNPADPLVVYFDDGATPSFDKESDALKLMNTDVKSPNLYTLSKDANRLSIDAIPYPDSISLVPLGLKTEQDGLIFFQAAQIENMPSGLQIYLSDKRTGINTDLLQRGGYKLNMTAGSDESRFSLIFSWRVLPPNQNGSAEFVVYPSGRKLMVSFTGTSEEKGDLVVYNMMGQEIFRRQLPGTGTHELDPHMRDGVYVVSFYSGQSVYSKKIIITN